MDFRQQLRNQLRQSRRALTVSDQQQASVGIAALLNQHLGDSPIKGYVGLYLANDGEPNLRSWAHWLWQQQIPTALPVMHPFSRNHMLFQHFDQRTELSHNRFKIQEPCLNKCAMVLPSQLELILTPLVGFDGKGNRLGMGGGFYDRYLAHCPQAIKIGVAHDCQQVDAIPVEPWDIGLNYIVTPTQWLEIVA
ncbi:5-formyltetrahydrofolate cyclo-ligase [Ferrimonas aestuarii]|uniref:5-formyltetrahydrofolate cyclo-ligase n=1 Tax=Ferrimonas aestuarii TaxID=2569539 RepID=A0A4U1BJJ6_9GAMM|nr:5-formyltetrahydrofolate cyclo-ligase [Ferrimonas aestuarii]TKB50721.1 5-formyltetrahydrofolate cyclo-ligase [Ferrimonas aestuarii]